LDGRDGKRQQGYMPLATQGGAAEKPIRSEADKALDARLTAVGLTREAFDAACRTWKPADAHRWLVAKEGWMVCGSPQEIQIPSFHDYVARPNRFRDDLEAAEAMWPAQGRAADDG
jgi:hypothetical protein